MITGESNFDEKKCQTSVQHVFNLISTCVQLNGVTYILELLVTKLVLWSPYVAMSTEGDFSLLKSGGGGTFGLHVWNLHKI